MRRTLLSFALIVSAACGDADPPPPVGDTELASTVVPECTDGYLEWEGNDETCAGVWQYTELNHPCPDPRGTCETGEYATTSCSGDPQACRHHEFGKENVHPPQARTSSVSGHWETTDHCVRWAPLEECDEWSCPEPRCIQYARTFVEHESCYTRAQEALAAELAGKPGFGASATATYGNPGANSVVCHITLHNLPIYNYGTSGALCGYGPAHGCELGQYNSTNHTCTRTPIKAPCPELERGSCGVQEGARYSAPGVTRTTIMSRTPVDLFVAESQCLTGEDRSLAPAARHDFLMGQLASPPPGIPAAHLATHRRALVRKLQLLLELHADELGDAQIDATLPLYREHPGIAPACDEPFVAPTTASQCDAADLNLMLEVCGRLTAGHAPAASAARLADRCFDVIAGELEGLPADAACRADEYAARARTLYAELVRKAVGKPNPPQDAGEAERDYEARLTASLGKRLHHIDRWYAAARDIEADARALSLEASRIVGAFWATAYEGVTFDATNPASITNLSNHRLRVDRLVIQAAFADPAPLTSAPLLYVLNDALAGVSARLADVAEFHDLGCRFREPACQSSGGLRSPVSELWLLMGSIADRDLLTQRVAGLKKTPEPWRKAFAALVARHDALTSAARDAAGVSTGTATQLLLESSTPPQAATALARLLRDARARAESYLVTGFFRVTEDRVLRSGVHGENIDAILLRLDKQVTSLEAKIAAYKAGFAVLAQALVNEVDQTLQLARIDARFQANDLAMTHIEADVGALRRQETLEEARFAAFMKTFETVAQLLTQADQLIQFEPEAPFTVGSSPRYTRHMGRELVTRISTTGEQPWKSVGRGEIVNIDVAGEWSPTCAAQKHPLKVLGPDGWLEVDFSGAQIGPEGFRVTRQNSDYNASQVSHTNSSTEFDEGGMTNEWCLTGKVGVSYNALLVAEFALTEAHCGYYNFGKRNEETSSSGTSAGNENRLAGSASVGVRSIDAALPTMPYGALVLVAVPAGKTLMSDAVEMRVVQRGGTAFVAPEDVDLYLVVNDLFDASCAFDSNVLTVSARRMVPSGILTRIMGEAMASALMKLRDEVKSYAGRGRIVPSELATLRAEATTELRLACARIRMQSLPAGASDDDRARIAAECDEAQYPEAITGVFHTFVNREIARAERLVELEVLRRQTETLVLENRAIADELTDTVSRGRLVKMQSQLALRNLDAEELRAEVRNLVQLMDTFVYPVTLLRYPKALARIKAPAGVGFSNATQVALELLIQADFAAPIEDHAGLAKTVVQAVRAELAHAQTEVVPVTRQTIMLSFPNPDSRLPPVAGQPRPPFASSLKTVDPVRAKQVWDAIEAGRTPTFVVLPEDVYVRDSGTYQLTCTQTVPVIRNVLVYLGIPNNGPFGTAPGKTVQAFVHPVLRFAAATEDIAFRLINTDWLAPTMTVLLGRPDDIHDNVEAPLLAGSQGVGRSPFTAFDIKLAGLRIGQLDPFYDVVSKQDPTKEIVLVFHVEVGTSHPGITWVPGCQP